MRGRNLRRTLVAAGLVAASAVLVLVLAVAGLLAFIVTSAGAGSSWNASMDELSAALVRTEVPWPHHTPSRSVSRPPGRWFEIPASRFLGIYGTLSGTLLTGSCYPSTGLFHAVFQRFTQNLDTSFNVGIADIGKAQPNMTAALIALRVKQEAGHN